MTVDPTTFVAICGMAVVTVLTRLAGFWLVRRIAVEGRLAAALEAVPGAILISLIAPIVLAKGPAESIAALYNPYIADSTVTFEEQPVTASTMAERMDAVAAAGLPWLRADWPEDGLDGVPDDDPRARVTFGIWDGRDELIFVQESY